MIVHRSGFLRAGFFCSALVVALGCGAESGADVGRRAGEPAGEAVGLAKRSPARFGECGDEWAPAAPLLSPRRWHASTLLPDGKVLVLGGRNDEYPYPTSVQAYDPVTDSWEINGSLLENPTRGQALLLPDGRVLLGPSTQIYDPATGLATFAPPTPFEQTLGYPLYGGMTITLLPNGKVLRTGGHEDWTTTDEAVLYDPQTDTWSSAGALSEHRRYHTATLLPDGRVLVAGSYSMNGELPSALTSAELYDPATNTWAPAASTNVPRSTHTATLLPSGRVLVVGGSGYYTGETEEEVEYHEDALTSAEIYDPATDTWTLTAPMVGAARGWGHTATLLADGRVLVAGNSWSPDVSIYDEALDAWTAAPPLTAHRNYATATLLPDGSVLVVGGTQAIAISESVTLSSVERYCGALAGPPEGTGGGGGAGGSGSAAGAGGGGAAGGAGGAGATSGAGGSGGAEDPGGPGDGEDPADCSVGARGAAAAASPLPTGSALLGLLLLLRRRRPRLTDRRG